MGVEGLVVPTAWVKVEVHTLATSQRLLSRCLSVILLNKVTIVTGSSIGIGAAVTLELAKKEAHVVV